ncbi:hypothetical protein AMATHDRAFT_74624 [Amanita thiersii Skay4041]|uniref:D-xylose 1-dehydrogenase (NADP(+), D-xylono-1,5-lactone-forming) n=1 Tax=Amanita thiersii Skay4041 TaxID=703135 RepID=A0A2A9NW61_9AGAR|nr:hypothetical protein AMATHDRAFT_74624 [Amanita thiersii Skay4041]
MATNQPLIISWGIISTGGIAARFVKDLLVDPKTRNVHDIVHKVAAVGSRTAGKAHQFINAHAGGNPSIRAYGTYEEVYTHKEVNVVYIGTPHTHHYTNALDAIKAGKNILCEKPVTCNAAELLSLLDAAKKHNVFFMEAMWTRFQPLSLEVKRIAEEGSLGAPVVLHADLSGNLNINNIPKTHRILDPDLGGGGLLDIGPYPLFWAILTLYENPRNTFPDTFNVTAAMLMTPLTNVDCNTAFTVTWPSPSFAAQAVLSCSINVNSLEIGVVIRFERGVIKIPSPIYCPKEFTVQYHDGQGKLLKEERRLFEYVGGGWHFQADEVARCVRDGKEQSQLWGHDKSLLEMRIFDEVRRQGGYVFPPGVEKVV